MGVHEGRVRVNPWRTFLDRPKTGHRDYSEESACLGKQAHDTWASAEQAVERIITENVEAGTPHKSSRLSSYRCRYCGKWHVGHSAGPFQVLS